MAKISISWLKKIEKNIIITPNWVGNELVTFRRDIYFQNLLTDDPMIKVFLDDSKMEMILDGFKNSPTCAWHRTPYLYLNTEDGITYRILANDNVRGIKDMRMENVTLIQERILQKAVGVQYIWTGMQSGSFITDNIGNPTVIMMGAIFNPTL